MSDGGMTIGEVLMGRGYDNGLMEMLWDHDRQLSTEEARRVLSAMSAANPTARTLKEVIDDGTVNGKEFIEYDLGDAYGSWIDELIGGASQIERDFLFSDRAYMTGFMSRLYSVIESAYPGYEVPESQGIGTVVIRRKSE